ncbi:MAG: hypothetical protein AB7D47_00025 [Desulfovibrio sp.]|jgi:hypothetical protein
MEQGLFLQYLLFGLGVLVLLALAAPFLAWRNSAEAVRLLREILLQQEDANAMNAEILHRLERLERLEIHLEALADPLLHSHAGTAAPSPRMRPGCGPHTDCGPDADYGPDADLDQPEDAAAKPAPAQEQRHEQDFETLEFETLDTDRDDAPFPGDPIPRNK